MQSDIRPTRPFLENSGNRGLVSWHALILQPRAPASQMMLRLTSKGQTAMARSTQPIPLRQFGAGGRVKQTLDRLQER
jgi:hypothetical protein